jgi:hypothetical protein
VPAIALLPTSSVESVAAVETTTAPAIKSVEQTTQAVEQPTQAVETTTAKAEPTTTQATVETTAAPVVKVQSTSTSSSSSSSATSSTSSNSNSGEATFYGGNVSGGTCSFTGYSLPSTLFGTALSLERWDDAANCGRCVSVTGPNGNSVKAMVSESINLGIRIMNPI